MAYGTLVGWYNGLWYFGILVRGLWYFGQVRRLWEVWDLVKK